MRGSESKLLSGWARDHNRGMIIFVLTYGIALLTIPFVAVGFLSRLLVFQGHPLHWDDTAYIVGAGLVCGLIRGIHLWNKMERLYANVAK
jgi:hypothetical protein